MTTETIAYPYDTETAELRKAFGIIYTCAPDAGKQRIEQRLRDPDFNMTGGSILTFHNYAQDEDGELVRDGQGDAILTDPRVCLLGLLAEELRQEYISDRVSSGRFNVHVWSKLISRSCVKERTNKHTPADQQKYFYSVWDAFCRNFSATTGKAVLLDELNLITAAASL